MEAHRSLACGTVVLMAACLMGCDAWYAQYQGMSVRVTEVQSGDAVAGARVSALDAKYVDPRRGYDPAEEMARLGSRGANTAETEENGVASMYINTTLHKSGFGVMFDPREPLQDEITGNRYVLRVAAAERVELLWGVAVAGETIAGEVFVMEVLDIGDPNEGPTPRVVGHLKHD